MIESEKYDWGNLKAAKDASKTPLVISNLAKTESIAEAENLRSFFEYNIIYNEDVFEAAVPTIHCILSSIAESSPSGRAIMFDLLYDLGAGYCDLDDQDEHVELERQCRSACKNGVSQYIYYLEKGTNAEKRCLPDLIELCSRDDSELRDRLIWILERMLINEEEGELIKVYESNLADLKAKG